MAQGVAVNPRLAAYLSLEQAMVDLDDAGDPLAEALRDTLDPLWYALSEAEQTMLNDRTILDSSLRPIRLPADRDSLFIDPPVQPAVESTTRAMVGREFDDWESAA